MEGKCVRCGSPLKSGGLCSRCYDEMRGLLVRVKAYLSAAPSDRRGVEDVARAVGVSPSDVWILVRAGYVSLDEGKPSPLKGDRRCRRCGVPLEKGEYCPVCAAEISSLARDLSRALEEGEEKGTWPGWGEGSSGGGPSGDKGDRGRGSRLTYGYRRHGRRRRGG